jgi:hypothetical protein
MAVVHVLLMVAMVVDTLDITRRDAKSAMCQRILP